MVEGQKVKDQSGNDVYLYENTTTINWKDYAGDKFPEAIETTRRKVVAIAFKGVHQEVKLAELEDFGILDGDDYYYYDGEKDESDPNINKVNVFPKIKNDIEELDLSEWGKSFCEESYYFSGMKKLKLIKLPANPFSINDTGMFSDCKNLTTIKWSQQKASAGDGINYTVITAIGTNAFSGCVKLHEYYIQRMIDDCAKYTPQGTDEKTHAEKNIGEGAFRNCLELGDKDEPEETGFGVDGTYDTEDYDNPEELKNASGQLIIPSGITGIGNEAFKQDAGKSELAKVTFEYYRTNTTGHNVTIGEYAFDGQGLLKDVEQNGAGVNGVKITALGKGAFRNCRAITSESVNNILANYAANCSSKDENDDVSIPEALFEGCNGKGDNDEYTHNFTELIIPSNVKSIGGCAFGSRDGVGTMGIKTIKVSRGTAPSTSEYYAAYGWNFYPFNDVIANDVTIEFYGDAAKYDESGNTGYMNYLNDKDEFGRLLTKDIFSYEIENVADAPYDGFNASYTYKVAPQQHAKVRLHRKLVEGWNTLCLPFGVTEGAAAIAENTEMKNCNIIKKALNNAGNDEDFMIALYRDYVPATNTFRFLRIFESNKSNENKYLGAEIPSYQPFMVKMTQNDLAAESSYSINRKSNNGVFYTFENVDLNYDWQKDDNTGKYKVTISYPNGKIEDPLISPAVSDYTEENATYKNIVSSYTTENQSPNPATWTGKSGFTQGGTNNEYAFTGTFVTLQGTVGSSATTADGSNDDNTKVNQQLTTKDYFIQTVNGATHSYQLKSGYKIRAKAFCAWFHNIETAQNAKPASISVNIVGEDNETTEIVNVNQNGDEIVSGNIYNINGQLVGANASDKEGLPKGVYIMNGKKFVVK